MTERSRSGRPRTRPDRARYRQGLPDHHDPLAGFAGAPPAQSPLTLRLVLAIIGVVLAGGGAAIVAVASAPVAFVIVLCVLGAVYLVDLAVITRRKLRGEPG